MQHISYILEDEYNHLLEQKKNLEKEFKIQSERKRNACQQWAETWHDNFDYEDAELQQNIINTRIKNLSSIINQTKILLQQNIINNWKVQIWSKVKISIDNIQQECEIWGYPTIPWRISYKSPLWSTLYNQKIWSKIIFTHNNKTKKIVILSINP